MIPHFTGLSGSLNLTLVIFALEKSEIEYDEFKNTIDQLNDVIEDDEKPKKLELAFERDSKRILKYINHQKKILKEKERELKDIIAALSRAMAELDVDNQVALGPENIFVPPGGAAAGTYQVYVVYYCGQIPTQASVEITVFANTAQEQSATFVRTLTTADLTTGHNVANVTFPSGTIQETTGTRPSAVQLSATKN